MKPDSREALARAMQEEKCLQVCARHPETVYFEGKFCPACSLLREHSLRENHEIIR